ncbi:MAG: hypothetical protein HC895_02575 [Leptolyngbyaceae cyanobacterium SM1_3_5]|nr:hypothetical protein [Leptolyngbyaceae cyanobacterium SM1_3_5]
MLQRYLVAIDRHKWAAIAGFLVVMSLSGVAAMQPQPPSEFVAAGTLAYSAPPVTLSQTGTALQQQGNRSRQNFCFRMPLSMPSRSRCGLTRSTSAPVPKWS